MRGTVAKEFIKWTEEDAHFRGIAPIKLPTASALNCVVSYDGVAQHHWWLVDPVQLQNARRAVYEAFDNRLETLKDIIAKALRKGEDARDLEAGVGWLLWMLGVSVAQLGGARRTQDAADLIALSSGDFAVIECTTGLLKADNKLPLPHDRAQTVRRALASSGHDHLRVLPIMVTSKTREDVRVEMEQAEQLGHDLRRLVMPQFEFVLPIAGTVTLTLPLIR